MRAYFKPDNDGIQRLMIEAENDIDRQQMDEFFQREIPGYEHNISFSHNKMSAQRVSSFYFEPAMTRKNLKKEGFSVNYGAYQYDSRIIAMDFGSFSLLYDTITKYYEVLNGNDKVIEYGVLRNVYQLRKVIDRINGYQGDTGLMYAEYEVGDRFSRLL